MKESTVKKNKKCLNAKIILMLVMIGNMLATVISGCTIDTEIAESQNSDNSTVPGGEHQSEGGESGNENSAGDSGEESGNTLALSETYDTVRKGARLIMNYDKKSNSFEGIVENTTGNTLPKVRVEVHLSNGTELGPTAPVDLAPGEKVNITLLATKKAFNGWTPHAEVGGNEHGSEGSNEGSEEGNENNKEGNQGSEHSGKSNGEGIEGNEHGSEDSGESGDPSSPILTLDESWDGVVNGIRTAMSYDSVRGSFSGIVENTTNKTIHSILIELNLKQGTKTVVELGPYPVGDLEPGEQSTVELLVSEEPEAVGVTFDAWEIHPEAEGTAEGDSEVDGEQHGEGSEGSESRGEHDSGGD